MSSHDLNKSFDHARHAVAEGVNHTIEGVARVSEAAIESKSWKWLKVAALPAALGMVRAMSKSIERYRAPKHNTAKALGIFALGLATGGAAVTFATSPTGKRLRKRATRFTRSTADMIATRASEGVEAVQAVAKDLKDEVKDFTHTGNSSHTHKTSSRTSA